MASHQCPHCGAYSSEPGRCVVCKKPIGNLGKAISAALASAVVLSVLWIGLAWISGMQLSLLAIAFGGIISLCTTHFSGGRGILYQLIATVVTVVAIVFADGIALMMMDPEVGFEELNSLTAADLLAMMEYHLKYDPATPLFYVLGVMGGFWIWR